MADPRRLAAIARLAGTLLADDDVATAAVDGGYVDRYIFVRGKRKPKKLVLYFNGVGWAPWDIVDVISRDIYADLLAYAIEHKSSCVPYTDCLRCDRCIVSITEAVAKIKGTKEDVEIRPPEGIEPGYRPLPCPVRWREKKPRYPPQCTHPYPLLTLPMDV